MIKKIAIYDIDGTLVDSMHRFRVNPETGRIDLDFWIENDTPEKIELDKLLPLADRYKNDLKNPEVYVILATARACEFGDANYEYIDKNLGIPDRFIHRKGREDTRGGAELKIKGIKPLLNLKNFKDATVHVYEDNIDYLKDLSDFFAKSHLTVGHYNPSAQGV